MAKYLFQVPPDFEKAKLHGESQKFRSYDPSIDIQSSCWYWCQRVSPEYSRPFRLWESPKKMIQYGDGFPLLFQFMRYIMILFTMLFFVQGLFNLLIAIIYWSKNNSSINLSKIFSIDSILNDTGNERDTIVVIYEVIAMLANFSIIALVWILWIKQEKFKNQLDEAAKTDADYAIMIENLPQNVKNGQIREALYSCGITDYDIIYSNKWFVFDKILKLKRQQLDWYQKRKYLAIYREIQRKNDHSYWKTVYPPTSFFTTGSCKGYPTGKIIVQKFTFLCFR